MIGEDLAAVCPLKGIEVLDRPRSPRIAGIPGAIAEETVAVLNDENDVPAT